MFPFDAPVYSQWNKASEQRFPGWSSENTRGRSSKNTQLFFHCCLALVMRSFRAAVLILYVTFACALAIEKRGSEHGDSKDSSTPPSLSAASSEHGSDTTGPVTPPPPGSERVRNYHQQMGGFHGAFVPAAYRGQEIRPVLPLSNFNLKLPENAQNKLQEAQAATLRGQVGQGSRTTGNGRILTGRIVKRPKVKGPKGSTAAPEI
ncbi:hypothetical protein F5887DRAFT_964753 [Amanita rubescens]|nr:hypothetical protein F5887DRAFT_964753 [Amanita rubescens]